MRDRLIIFDGDDTLWSTQPLYDRVKDEFASLMQPLCHDRDTVVDLVDRIDLRQLPKLGYSPDRFPSSLDRTYRLLARNAGSRVESLIRKRVRALGNSVFTSAPVVYSDVVDSLSAARAHYRIVLFTKGDQGIQLRRINESGLKAWFDEIVIAAEKTPAEYEAILRSTGIASERAWTVGNSVRSDINPALMAGIRGILLRNKSWAAEDTEVPGPGIAIAGTVWEALELILQKDGLASSD